MNGYEASKLTDAIRGCAWMIVFAIAFHGCVTSVSTVASGTKQANPTTQESK